MILSAPLRLQKLKFYSIYLLLLFYLILPSGCAKKEDPLYSKNEAELKFIQTCKNDHNLNVITHSAGNSFWIYLPYEKDILYFKASSCCQLNQCEAGYLKGDFREKNFYFEYQVINPREDMGYTYSLTYETSQDFQYILNAIYSTFFVSEEQPEFYVITLSDITNGVEIIYTIKNSDLKMIYYNVLPQEEVHKRIVQTVRGDLMILNDKTGGHINYQEIYLNEFLTEQIVQRIRMSFSNADSQLCKNTEEEILKIISYCMYAYEYTDFSGVIVNNLYTKTKTTVPPEKLITLIDYY